MEAYTSWVRRNQQWLSSLESVANTLTWLLPERLANSEVAPEAVSTLVGLLTVLNRYIIETTPLMPPNQASASLGQHSVSAPKQQKCFPWSFMLSIVKEFDVLVEVTADYFLGNETKWTPIAMNEAVKTLIRIIIFHNSGYRILLDGGETQNLEDNIGKEETSMRDNREMVSSARNDRTSPFTAGKSHSKGNDKDIKNPSSQSMETWAKQSLVKFGERVGGMGRPSWSQSQLLSARPSEVSQAGDSKKLIAVTRNRGYIDKLVMVGEVLFVLRPLIYVLLIRRYGLRSWKPWLSSIFLDLAAVNLQVFNDRARSKIELAQGGITSFVPLSDPEKQELRRRRLLLALHLFRDPFFSKYSRPRLEYMERLFKPLPVVGFLSEKALEFLYGIQGFYSYTSGS
ncbi:hypothetical protein O6H91_Y233100 [Diphasiastrum complanatum]|nr:hypothetical protein O6H91_Y233100 [Diphasiastrum complanatum]KAJ7299435.1 hypothetical protein O6H91_Y233100 [Diphasiastrum complanatum]KAJ7299440.1 hypothetical protein O6H91_Y233100 [Diphasiastrum complanatum]